MECGVSGGVSGTGVSGTGVSGTGVSGTDSLTPIRMVVPVLSPLPTRIPNRSDLWVCTPVTKKASRHLHQTWKGYARSGCPFPRKRLLRAAPLKSIKKPNFIEFYKISRSLDSRARRQPDGGKNPILETRRRDVNQSAMERVPAGRQSFLGERPVCCPRLSRVATRRLPVTTRLESGSCGKKPLLVQMGA